MRVFVAFFNFFEVHETHSLASFQCNDDLSSHNVALLTSFLNKKKSFFSSLCRDRCLITFAGLSSLLLSRLLVAFCNPPSSCVLLMFWLSNWMDWRSFYLHFSALSTFFSNSIFLQHHFSEFNHHEKGALWWWKIYWCKILLLFNGFK